MFTCFKGWLKGIITVFLATLFINSLAQGEKLQPEMDYTSGLQSNAVRCIKVVPHSNTWVGTDNGLNILGGLTTAQRNIIQQIGNRSIWGLEIMDSLLFVGTRFDGLQIYNIYTGGIIQSFPPAAINLIRKIKIFNWVVFILTDNGTFKWAGNRLSQLRLAKAYNRRFIIDMFQYERRIYGISYNDFKILEYTGSGFGKNRNKEFIGKDSAPDFSVFCAAVDNDKVYFACSGVVHQIIVKQSGKPARKIPILKSFSWGYIIWDIQIEGNKLILAVGDIYTNEKGMLCVLNKSGETIDVKAKEYITCLAADITNDCLYYGTLLKGLFLQKGLSASLTVDKPTNTNLIGNEKHTIFFDNEMVYQADNTTLKSLRVRSHFTQDIGPSLCLALVGDTLVCGNNDRLQLFRANTLRPFNLQRTSLITKTFIIPNLALLRENDSASVLTSPLFRFNSYGVVYKHNIQNNTETVLDSIISFSPYPQVFGKKIILLNREKGFNIITPTEAYKLANNDNELPFATDFTAIGDTMYVLLRNRLVKILINYKARSLSEISSFNITSMCEDFAPKWLLSFENNLYLLNGKGILQVSPENGIPLSYYYFGNIFEMQKPVIAGDKLLWATSDMLTAMPFSTIGIPSFCKAGEAIGVSFPDGLNENISFKIVASIQEYILENHSLKSLEIWHKGRLLDKKYTISNTFSFDNGLKYGEYELVLKGGNMVVRRDLSISLPLSRNPYFFITIFVLSLCIVFIAVKYGIDRRTLTKKLTQNRLQTLKQNFNPHFVYNSMNLISSLILEEKYDEAVQVVADFSKLQRMYLETNNKEKISLAEEIEFLKVYIKLQQRRFHEDNEFECLFVVQPGIDISKVMLPPLILQPLAENAVKYGIIGSKAINKVIHIDVSGPKPLIIGIEDNGMDVDPDIKGLGMGQRLVQERITLYNTSHGANIKIALGKTPIYSPTGYRVELEIPD